MLFMCLRWNVDKSVEKFVDTSSTSFIQQKRKEEESQAETERERWDERERWEREREEQTGAASDWNYLRTNTLSHASLQICMFLDWSHARPSAWTVWVIMCRPNRWCSLTSNHTHTHRQEQIVFYHNICISQSLDVDMIFFKVIYGWSDPHIDLCCF